MTVNMLKLLQIGHYLLVDTWLRWLRWLSWSDVYSCCILLRASCGTCSLQTELAGAEKNAELCEVLRDEMSTLKPKIQSSMVRYTAKCRCNGRENMGKNCIKQPNFTFCMNFPQIICCWTDGCIILYQSVIFASIQTKHLNDRWRHNAPGCRRWAVDIASSIQWLQS